MAPPLLLHELGPDDVPGPRGFLPAYDPLARLPGGFEVWDELAADLPARIVNGRFRHDIAAMPELDPSSLEDGGETERAMLLLSLFAGAFVHGAESPDESLPPPLARPLVAVAKRLGRPPILSHQSLVLHNWRRLDPAGPIALGNLAHLAGAHGSTDELWFLMTTVAIEREGGAIPALAVRMAERARRGDADGIIAGLEKVAGTIHAITELADRTREHCDPHVFYRRVRPPFSGWAAPGVRGDGIGQTEPLVLAGGIAVQSPLIQLFDALLSVRHLPAARPIHEEMRRYMNRDHRRFVGAVEADGSVRRFAAAPSSRSVWRAYTGVVDELARLRRVHLRLVHDYISAHAGPGQVARGAGGTDYGAFLGTSLDGTEQARWRG